MIALSGDLVLLDVGNTHTRVFREGAVRRIKSADLGKILPELAAADCAAASVVPEWTFALADAGVFMVGKEHCAGLDMSAVSAATVGADRIANAVALAAAGVFPAVAVDFGTAITFEVLDGKGRFIGGAILPGRALMRSALAAGAAQLPELAAMEMTKLEIGADTAGAMALGCDRGAVGAVKEVLRSVLRSVGGAARVVGTGGDAAAFAGQIPELSEIDATLTLQGIALAYNYER